MAKRPSILCESDTAWHAGGGDSWLQIPIPASATPEQIASAAAVSLKQLGHGASPITLAIPSNWCLCASIRTDDLPKADYKSLLYRLEEKLPWPAESITADFVRHENSALGICIKTEKIRPLIDALETRDIPIQTITPTALLAAAAQPASDSILVLQSRDHVDLLVMQNGKPSAWSVTTPEESDINLQFNLLSVDLPRVEIKNVEDLALRAAHQTAWINLRQHDLAASDKLRLHRRALNALLAS